VEVAAPFRLPAADLPVDPYPLGSWLAAGDGESGSLTGIDEDIVRLIRAAGHQVEQGDAPGQFTLPGLIREIERLGLREHKHIPAEYLRASEAQRRALLAGMLDTRGDVSETGRVRLALTDGRLAEDARELILSLGHRATITTEEGRSSEAPTLHRVG